jgi:hypothetical protein
MSGGHGRQGVLNALKVRPVHLPKKEHRDMQVFTWNTPKLAGYPIQVRKEDILQGFGKRDGYEEAHGLIR